MRSPWFEAWLGDTLAKQISAQTHEQATLGRARVTFFPPGAELTDLEIRSKANNDLLVGVAVIGAPLALGGSNGVRLGEVRVVDPVVRLELDQQGRLTSFRNPNGPQPAKNPLRELPLTGKLTAAVWL